MLINKQGGCCYMLPESNGKHGICKTESCLSEFYENKINDDAKTCKLCFF